MILKKIELISAAKLCGILYAILGLIFGAFISVLSLIGFSVHADGSGGGFAFGIGSIIILPLFYGFCGFIFGFIGAALYNLAASIVGGLEMKF